MLWDLCFKYKTWNIETLNYRKIYVFCVAELINGPRCTSQTSQGILLRFVSFAFWCLINFFTEKIGVSLELWALFVNIFVSEIEQKTILQFKSLKINFFFLELLPCHEEKSTTDHANKTYNPSKCVCLLEIPCM